MLWLMTMGRRLNGVYALYAGGLHDGRGRRATGADVEPVSQPRGGAQPFWVGLFYTVNAIAGILVSLWLAKRSDSQGDRRKLILFCCAMAVGNALLLPSTAIT